VISYGTFDNTWLLWTIKPASEITKPRTQRGEDLAGRSPEGRLRS